MYKVSVLIDGGNTRALCRNAKIKYNPDYIEKFSHACAGEDETIFRILYYDCAPFIGSARLPVSGKTHEFKGSDLWLHELARKPLFAVRRGVLKFRGFKPKRIPIGSYENLSDEDFSPDFEQKGVDMRIGLDIANYCVKKSVDKIVLATSDTDCIPAMKHARISGLEVVLIKFPNSKLAPELLEHCDFIRCIEWPQTYLAKC